MPHPWTRVRYIALAPYPTCPAHALYTHPLSTLKDRLGMGKIQGASMRSLPLPLRAGGARGVAYPMPWGDHGLELVVL